MAHIKTKENKVNEAYVSMYINQSDILEMSVDKAHVDKLGKPLLSFKNKSLSLENINNFVHLSDTYQFYHGRLEKKTPTENV